jgi:hypothetical protein
MFSDSSMSSNRRVKTALRDIADMSLSEVRAAARANEPGFKTILKLLTDNRFNKP